MPTYNFKNVGIPRENNIQNTKALSKKPIGIKTPLSLGSDREGIFSMHFKSVDQIKDNLKNLILTNHGERLGRFDYGANIRNITTEINGRDDFENKIMQRFKEAAAKFLPHINLKTFSVDYREIKPRGIAKANITVAFDIERLNIIGEKISFNIYAI